MDNKNCLNCKHSQIIRGDGLQQPSTAKLPICTINEENELTGGQVITQNTLKPVLCDRYEARIIPCCTYCQQPILAEEHSWQMWAGLDNRPVCNSDCGAKLEAAEIAYFFSD